VRPNRGDEHFCIAPAAQDDACFAAVRT
jgi:hypothetical protein